MSAAGVECVTRVSVNGSSDYLPRFRKIVACMADSVGMDVQESSAAELLLSELCADSMQGPDKAFSITLRTSENGIEADLPACETQNTYGSRVSATQSLCDRVKRVLSEGVDLIKHHAGLTVRLTKRSQTARRIPYARFSPHHRN